MSTLPPINTPQPKRPGVELTPEPEEAKKPRREHPRLRISLLVLFLVGVILAFTLFHPHSSTKPLPIPRAHPPHIARSLTEKQQNKFTVIDRAVLHYMRRGDINSAEQVILGAENRHDAGCQWGMTPPSLYEPGDPTTTAASQQQVAAYVNSVDANATFWKLSDVQTISLITWREAAHAPQGVAPVITKQHALVIVAVQCLVKKG